MNKNDRHRTEIWDSTNISKLCLNILLVNICSFDGLFSVLLIFESHKDEILNFKHPKRNLRLALVEKTL